MSDIDRVFANPKFRQEIIRLMEKWAKDTGRLTGVEWYERFQAQLYTSPELSYYCQDATLDKAARRAAGIEDAS